MTAEDTRYIPAALPPTEVIYFQNTKDSENRTLDASTGANYTITFPLPLPARGFWSLTIYNATNLLLFKNPISRYSIGDRVSLSCACQQDDTACNNVWLVKQMQLELMHHYQDSN